MRFSPLPIRLWHASFLCAMVLFAATTVGAQTPLTCSMVEQQRLTCNVDASLHFDWRLRGVLESGFTNTIVYRVYVFQAGRQHPLSVSAVAFAEVFQLYTEVYFISRDDVPGYRTCSTWECAVTEMSRFEVRFDPGPLDPDGEYFAAAVLEVNPLSAAHLAEARSWIAQSSGIIRLFSGEEQSFFGTFVNLFFSTERSCADLVRYFRSEPIEMRP